MWSKSKKKDKVEQGLGQSTNLACLRSSDSGASSSNADDNFLNGIYGQEVLRSNRRWNFDKSWPRLSFRSAEQTWGRPKFIYTQSFKKYEHYKEANREFFKSDNVNDRNVTETNICYNT